MIKIVIKSLHISTIIKLFIIHKIAYSKYNIVGSDGTLSIKKKEKKKWYKEIYKNISVKTQISEAKDKFSDFLELPSEVVNSSTKITCIENKDILIEGYKQIMDYYDDYIKIKTHNLDIVIDGKDLDIREITDFELVIHGQIYSLNYKL